MPKLDVAEKIFCYEWIMGNKIANIRKKMQFLQWRNLRQSRKNTRSQKHKAASSSNTDYDNYDGGISNKIKVLIILEESYYSKVAIMLRIKQFVIMSL